MVEELITVIKTCCIDHAIFSFLSELLYTILMILVAKSFGDIRINKNTDDLDRKMFSWKISFTNTRIRNTTNF
jgi:hypothetical protein